MSKDPIEVKIAWTPPPPEGPVVEGFTNLMIIGFAYGVPIYLIVLAVLGAISWWRGRG